MGVLEGKVAVVTGSGQGVGRGIALLLAREGAKIVTNNRKQRVALPPTQAFRSTALPGSEASFTEAEAARFASGYGDAESTAAEIIAEGGEAEPFYGDVADYDTAGRMIETAIKTFGRIDILVNNAAGLGFGPFLSVTPEDWEYQVSPKLNGSYNTMKHAVPHMIQQGSGRILNTVSDAWIGIAALSPYSAANAGLVALTKATAKELYRHGITVNAFAPQAESPGHVSFNATLRTMLEAHGVEIGDSERMRESEEAHGPAENLTFLAYLASDEAADISGSIFSVTGGGRVALYSEPTHISAIDKKGAAWTIDELRSAVRDQLLPNYVSTATQSEF
jgi:3-oxoacyl-[acyl-carrier protein] reductase